MMWLNDPISIPCFPPSPSTFDVQFLFVASYQNLRSSRSWIFTTTTQYLYDDGVIVEDDRAHLTSLEELGLSLMVQCASSVR